MGPNRQGQGRFTQLIPKGELPPSNQPAKTKLDFSLSYLHAPCKEIDTEGSNT